MRPGFGKWAEWCQHRPGFVPRIVLCFFFLPLPRHFHRVQVSLLLPNACSPSAAHPSGDVESKAQRNATQQAGRKHPCTARGQCMVVDDCIVCGLPTRLKCQACYLYFRRDTHPELGLPTRGLRVPYCSHQCQRTDWSRHRPHCPHGKQVTPRALISNTPRATDDGDDDVE